MIYQSTMLSMIALYRDIKSTFRLISGTLKYGMKADVQDIMELHIAHIAMIHREIRMKIKNIDTAFNRLYRALKKVSLDGRNAYATGSFQRMYDRFELYMFELNKCINEDDVDRFELIHNEDCSICMETMELDDISCINGHVFHKKCIVEWLNSRPSKYRTCPLCRVPM